MIVELHNKLGEPMRVEATRILLSDPINGPLALAVETAPRHYYIVDVGDGEEEMNRALRTFGIDKTVLVDKYDKPLPKPPGQLWKPPGIS